MGHKSVSLWLFCKRENSSETVRMSRYIYICFNWGWHLSNVILIMQNNSSFFPSLFFFSLFWFIPVITESATCTSPLITESGTQSGFEVSSRFSIITL